MSTFWKVRISTLIWGFTVSLVFTGHFLTALPMFVTMVVGNTLFMWWFTRGSQKVKGGQ